MGPAPIVVPRRHPYALPLRGGGPLVGRAGELDGVVRCLLAGRGVTVDGPPGVGKTRLIGEAAALLAARSDVHLVSVAATAASQPVPLGALATQLVGAPPGADASALVGHQCAGVLQV